MPPRDEQDYENRRQQIIDGALHVFADKGFERATNKDIADAAGIGSPGLIYHYFKDKSDLLRQVVQQRAPILRLINETDAIMDLPPREALTLFGQAFVETMTNQAAVGMLKIMLSESIRRPIVAEIVNTIGPGRGVAFLRSYLEHHMALGNLRRMDAAAAARCFVGPLVAFALSREVFRQSDAQSLSPEGMVETAVEIFLTGMESRSGEAAAASTTTAHP